MSRFLLIHGVYHGPECWDAVVEELRARGHECRAMALRGHGPQDRGTFDFTGVGFADYLEDVRAELAASDAATILVGHSLGGMLVRFSFIAAEVCSGFADRWRSLVPEEERNYRFMQAGVVHDGEFS